MIRITPPGQEGVLVHPERVGQMSSPHRHDEVELNLVTDGAAAYLLGSRRYTLRSNTLVWLFPRQDHLLLDMSPGFHYWLGVFRPEMVRRVCVSDSARGLLADDPPGNFCRNLRDTDATRLAQLFSLVSETSDVLARRSGLDFALLAAWETFCSADETPVARGIHPAVQAVARMIRDEDPALGLSEMAKRVFLSPAYLSALFAEETGVTISELRNRHRMRRFLKSYEAEPHENLLTLAISAGFGSYSQFHRVFTSQMGYPPSKGRRSFTRGEEINRTVVGPEGFEPPTNQL
jgi:AraC-like DNA-binding protein